MFDIGWQELIVIGVLALLVVGPRELPGLFRTVGRYVGKARSIAREFQRSMEDAARDVDGGALNQIRDAKRDFDKMARVDFSEQGKRAQESMMSGGKKAPAKNAAKASPGATVQADAPSAPPTTSRDGPASAAGKSTAGDAAAAPDGARAETAPAEPPARSAGGQG